MLLRPTQNEFGQNNILFYIIVYIPAIPEKGDYLSFVCVDQFLMMAEARDYDSTVALSV